MRNQNLISLQTRKLLTLSIIALLFKLTCPQTTMNNNPTQIIMNNNQAQSGDYVGANNNPSCVFMHSTDPASKACDF
jgi:hypothetical protein